MSVQSNPVEHLGAADVYTISVPIWMCKVCGTDVAANQFLIQLLYHIKWITNFYTTAS
jgi:ribosomal protein L37AE/L43A